MLATGLFLLALVLVGESCVCRMSSYAKKYCTADFAVVGDIVDNSCSGNEAMKYYIWCTEERIYKVKVKEVLRNPGNLKPGDVIEIYAPGSNDMCGIFIEKSDSSDVLIAGRYQDGFYDIDFCNSIATPVGSASRDRYAMSDSKCQRYLRRMVHTQQ